MTKKTIAGIELEFTEDAETGGFWGGVGSHGDLRYELFLNSDKDGPSIELIDIYESFLKNFDDIYRETQEKFRNHYSITSHKQAARIQQAAIGVDIIGLRQSPTGYLIEMCCRVSYALFRRSILFVVNIEDNKVTSIEI